MQGETNWGLIVSLAGLVLIVLSHLCATVWWMSKIATSLEILTKAVEDIKITIARHEATYITKEQAAREYEHVNQQIGALWNKVDKLQDKK